MEKHVLVTFLVISCLGYLSADEASTTTVTDEAPTVTTMFTDEAPNEAPTVTTMFTDEAPTVTTTATDEPPTSTTTVTDEALTTTTKLTNETSGLTDSPDQGNVTSVVDDCLYVCNNKQDCVQMKDICDGLVLCDDFSDELNSCDFPFWEDKVTCPTGNRIWPNQLPEAGDECWGTGRDPDDVLKDKRNIFSQWCQTATYSDHHGKLQTLSMFTCDNGTSCVRDSDICNGVADCVDKTDERTYWKDSQCACDQVPCGNGLCVNQSLACDGVDHCGDGADESFRAGCRNPNAFKCDDGFGNSGNSLFPNMIKWSMKYMKFNCNNGLCIHTMDRCNGQDDCGDNSDEASDCIKHDMCDSSQNFQCQLGGDCMPLSAVCDGQADCADGSDESECAYDIPVCAPGFLQCSTSKSCYLGAYKCDGDNDCPDGSDEMDCPGFGFGSTNVPNGSVIGITIGLIFWAILIVAVSVAIVVLRRRRFRRQYQRWTSRVPAMLHDTNHRFTPPTRMTQPIGPPAYSEVIQMDKPPSYSEVAGQAGAPSYSEVAGQAGASV